MTSPTKLVFAFGLAENNLCWPSIPYLIPGSIVLGLSGVACVHCERIPRICRKTVGQIRKLSKDLYSVGATNNLGRLHRSA
ncbi:hypothetical protein AGR9A_Lc10003 [Agrobacterium salinitolerans str. Hayward 0363]|nr:hypothetical protein AGR9A_Lc10003 [Agrobacterium salinitolerans str. Hayward 0363]